MSEVKRYEPEAHSYSGAHATMELEDDGDWVAYSDYEKLEAENNRLREALESISKNTCCDSCQEASKWAKQALEETEE